MEELKFIPVMDSIASLQYNSECHLHDS